MFEFRLANHSAILFNGDVPVALSGNLLKAQPRGGIAPYRDRAEVPYTAVEPYSGQNRICRFLVTQLQGKAQGSTLVLFRWIGPNLRASRGSTGRSSGSSSSGSSGPRRSSRSRDASHSRPSRR